MVVCVKTLLEAEQLFEGHSSSQVQCKVLDMVLRAGSRTRKLKHSLSGLKAGSKL